MSISNKTVQNARITQNFAASAAHTHNNGRFDLENGNLRPPYLFESGSDRVSRSAGTSRLVHGAFRQAVYRRSPGFPACCFTHLERHARGDDVSSVVDVIPSASQDMAVQTIVSRSRHDLSSTLYRLSNCVILVTLSTLK